MNDPKQQEQAQARKAWAFFSVLASMGQFAAFAARAVTSGKPRKYSPAYYAALPKRRVDRPTAKLPRPHSPQHVAAVTAQRAARRLKRMAKAERILAEKRRRQVTQLMRHARRLARQARKERTDVCNRLGMSWEAAVEKNRRALGIAHPIIPAPISSTPDHERQRRSPAQRRVF